MKIMCESLCVTYRSAPAAAYVFSALCWNSLSSASTLHPPPPSPSLGMICLPVGRVVCQRRQTHRDTRPSPRAAAVSSWRFTYTLTHWTLEQSWQGVVKWRADIHVCVCVCQCWAGSCECFCYLDPPVCSWLTFLSEPCCISAIGCCSYQVYH